MIKENSKTSYGKSSGKYDTTADFLTNIENRNGKFYTDKATIDKIGQVEARGEDFSPLNKRIMSSRASTEVQLINVNSKMRKNLFYFLTKKGRTFPLVKISFLKDIDSLGS